MSEPSTTRRSPWAALASVSIPLLCAGLAAMALFQLRQWQENRDHLLVTLEQTGAMTDVVERKIRREITPHHAQIDAARALVFQLLETAPIDAIPAARRAAVLANRKQRLEQARALTHDGLRAQPNSWQAAMLLGATTYLERSIERDPRLFTAYEEWHEPLLKAFHEAPSEEEPRRILGSAYLELWPALSPDRKVFARKLLRDLFADDTTAFARLGPIWLRVASDIDEAFALVPPRPKAWEQVLAGYAATNELDLYTRARARYLDSLETDLDQRLEDGLTRLRLGDDFHSRTRFARVITYAPTELRFAPWVDRALANYPPGLQPGGTGGAMERWLQWSLDMSRIWVYPLTPASLSRLAAAAGHSAPADNALAALLGGELVLAERLERQASRLTAPAWQDYWLTKATWMLDHDRFDETEAALRSVTAGVDRDPRLYLLRTRLARERGDAAAASAAAAEADALRADLWPASAWQHSAADSRLAFLSRPGARSLTIEVANAPPGGAVISVTLDGAVVREEAVVRGDRVRIRKDLDPDRPHRLEWRVLVGAPAQPGEARTRSATDG